MEKRYVLTLIGKDKPGIVDALTGLLADRGYNLEDSRMAVLGGEFAGMLLVAPKGEDHLVDLIPEMEELTGMNVTVRETTTRPVGGEGIPFLIHGYSMDHPGIVHALAHEVATFGANIEEMETTSIPAPLTGSPLFDVRMRVALPANVSIVELRTRLEEVGAERNIDVGVEPYTA